MKQSQMLINEPPLTFQPSLAKALGLDEAIVIQQLHYWLSNQKNEGRIDESGEKWVYNTYAEWQEDNFPFWSEDKIQRVFLSLEKQGVVISAQLDAKKRDMRKFYRIDYDVLCAMDDAILRPSNTANLHDVKMNQRLPETTKDSVLSAKDLEQVNSKVDAIIANGHPQDELTAINAFEQAFGLDRPWNWYPDAPADKRKTWKDFREYVKKLHTVDPDCFTKYVTWSRQDYVKGSMTALGIKRNPQDFPDSWSAFSYSTKYHPEAPKTVRRDENNIPVTY